MALKSKVLSVSGFIDRPQVGSVLDLQPLISHRLAICRFPPGAQHRAASVSSRKLPTTQSIQRVSVMATSSLQLFSSHGAVQRLRCHPPPPRPRTTRTRSSTATVESGDKIGICCSTRQKENTLGRKICGTFAAVQHSNRWRGAGCRAK